MSPARHPGIPCRRWTPTGWGWVLPKRTNPRWKADLPHPICVRTSRDTMGLRSTMQRPELDAHTGSSRQFRVPDTYNLPTIVVRSRNGIVSERLPLWPGQSWSSPRSEPWVWTGSGEAVARRVPGSPGLHLAVTPPPGATYFKSAVGHPASGMDAREEMRISGGWMLRPSLPSSSRVRMPSKPRATAPWPPGRTKSSTERRSGRFGSGCRAESTRNALYWPGFLVPDPTAGFSP